MATAAVRRGSAYPVAVTELVPTARALAAQLGRLPSRNQLMRELRVGAGKASRPGAMLTAEAAGGAGSGEPSRTDAGTGVARRLRRYGCGRWWCWRCRRSWRAGRVGGLPTDELASWVADRGRCLWETTFGEPSPWTGKHAWLLGTDRPVVCRAIRTGALSTVRRRSRSRVSAHALVWLLDQPAVTVTTTPGGRAGGGDAR